MDASAAEVDGLDEVGDASRRLQTSAGSRAHANVFKHQTSLVGNSLRLRLRGGRRCIAARSDCR